MSSTIKLAQIASEALSPLPPFLSPTMMTLAGQRAGELMGLLSNKNGFYAFESALHVFSAETEGSETDLNYWNAPTCWKAEYGDDTAGCLFFAEDIFGGQFCIKENQVFTFDPETGSTERLGENLEQWATTILKDYDVLTGYPIAHKWQSINGPIPPGMRLVPKIPFILGGEFDLNNLHLLESGEAMRLRANIARQIKDLPDGSKIRVKLDE